MLRLNRRGFIKLVAGSGVLLAVGKSVELVRGAEPIAGKAAEVASPILGVKYGMVIDVGKCIGCRRCMYACKRENNVPDTISPPWIIVFETQSEMGVSGLQEPEKGTMMYTKFRRDRWYTPVQCFHCDNPPCVQVCPTGATYKDTDGIVMIDYGKCIGCKYCQTACPYNARRYNWWEPEIPPEDVNPLVQIRPKSVVEKCTFCVHRVRKGTPPRCVEVCPVRARHFGNLNDPDSEVSKILETERNIRLKEELNTEPRLWYIMPPVKRSKSFYRPLPPPEEVRGVRP